MANHARALVLVLLVVGPTAPGCTLLESYPAPDVEICDGMGIDEDFDGASDCDDSECVCPEDDARACGNARDDDRDGRIDAADANCWPVSRVTIDRCATLHAGTTQLVSTIAETWTQVGAITTAEDPDRPGHFVAGLLGLQTELTTAATLAGLWNGTHVSARVFLDPSSLASVRLAYASDPSATDAPTVTLGNEILTLSWGTARQDTASAPIRPGWVTLSIDVDGAGARASAVRDDGARFEAALSTPEGWPDQDPIRVAVTIATDENMPGRALFDTLEVVRPDVPCPRPVGELAGNVGSIVRADDGSLCAFAVSAIPGQQPLLFRSSDEGASWSDEPLDSPPIWGSIHMLRVPGHEGLVGVAQVELTGPLEVLHASGRCDAFVDRGPALGASEPTLEPHRSFLTIGVASDGTPHFELWSVTSDAVSLATSATGEPGSFRVVGPLALPDAIATGDPSFAGRAVITSVGGDRVVIAPSLTEAIPGRRAPFLDLFTEVGGVLTSAELPLGASGITGRFDASCIDEVLLVPDAVQPARGFAGHAYARCSRGPYAVLPLSVLPR